ncbi:MAG: alpha/beta hydrolase [Alphaproteobacteria bacterium]|nr:alpha/beta hydrolase [Alphaproteobacteria bacterium]MCB9792422.1 alpha/beta hydrolase [Alphaproteobacteria bacterium]
MTLALSIGAGLIALAALLLGAYALRNLRYHRWDMARVRRAGFVEREAEVAGVSLRYAEGPASGPPLLLIHGQSTDWQSYARVLPALARAHHVYVIDCPGHGGSARLAQGYTARGVAALIAGFIEQVIGAPTLVSGHSSGGVLAAILAAEHPEQLTGALLEDPPLFTTAPPRSHTTWNYVDLATACQGFLADEAETDFVAYYLAHARFWRFFGDGQARLIAHGLAVHRRHPERPVRYWFLPPSINETFRALGAYDPYFGLAFWDGSWDEGLDHAELLPRIRVPVALIHANWTTGEDGVLQGAMHDTDAARAAQLMGDAPLIRVDSGHGFHFEKPQDFLRILADFAPG